MRAFLVCVVLSSFVGSAAQAGVSFYPPAYHPQGSDYYDSLRSAKLAWLKANLAALNLELATDRARLPSLNGAQAASEQASVDRLTTQAGQIEVELKVMTGARNASQEALLKRNVQSWIGAARRGGDGGEALRLMHDLEGTGL